MDAVTWRDNPILIKHLRSRLRRHEVWPASLVVLFFAGFITYVTANNATTPTQVEYGYRFMVALQGLIIFVLGTAQVFSSVFRSRESNMLDFHRISPLSALTLVIGFAVGAPIREYLMLAITLPFSLYGVLQGAVPLLGWLLITGSIVLAAFLYHLAALVVGLVTEKGKAGYGIVGAGVLMLYVASMAPPMSYLTIVPAYQFMLTWLTDVHAAGTACALQVLHQGLFILFLLLGATRKMRRDESPFWSKPVTLVLFFLLARVAAIDLHHMGRSDLDGYMTVPALYFLWGAALGLVGMATPSFRDYLRGLRRARRLGSSQAPTWSDAAPSRAVLLGLTALLTTGVALLPVSRQLKEVTGPSLALAGLVAGLSLLAFGGALQTFSLHYRRKSRAYFWFLLFVLYIGPLLVSAMVALVPQAHSAAQCILALSPLAALGLVAGGSSTTASMVALGANALLAVFFTWKGRVCEREAAAQVSA